MNISKLAAIDIGSNAVRLLICSIIEESGQKPIFQKYALIRVPVRLGSESFLKHKITGGTEHRLLDTMIGFKHIMRAHGVRYFRACATSAMRDASNAKTIIQDVKKRSGITIEVISGDTEANMIFKGQVSDLIQNSGHYLYVDVGGGSTELSYFSKGKLKGSRSFQIGTVRLLNKAVADTEWKEMKAWLQEIQGKNRGIQLIGSGGNINRLFKLSLHAEGEPLVKSYIQKMYKEFRKRSVYENVRDYGLNYDRAEVIHLALKIYLQLLDWTGADLIHVPKVGLSDGIVRQLYEDVKARRYSELRKNGGILRAQ